MEAVVSFEQCRSKQRKEYSLCSFVHVITEEVDINEGREATTENRLEDRVVVVDGALLCRVLVSVGCEDFSVFRFVEEELSLMNDGSRARYDGSGMDLDVGISYDRVQPERPLSSPVVGNFVILPNHNMDVNGATSVVSRPDSLE
jgi:hypothetical protein